MREAEQGLGKKGIMKGVAGRITLLLVGLLTSVAIGAENSMGLDTQERPPFNDIGAWTNRLEGPARDRVQRPDQVIAALGVAKDAVVADIGSGTGYFAVRLARAAPHGRVYGADTEPAMVSYLAQRATA